MSVKYTLNPLTGERLLGVVYSERKKSGIILPGEIAKKKNKNFMKIVAIGDGEQSNKYYKVGDFVLIRQGAEVPMMELGLKDTPTMLIEFHQILSKVEILEGEVFPLEFEEETITPEQVKSINRKIHEA
jgi:co-chaperonin GroES (HSP10)